MSRQSLAVNSSGALTGTTPDAASLPFDLDDDLQRAGRPAVRRRRSPPRSSPCRRQLLLGADLRALDARTGCTRRQSMPSFDVTSEAAEKPPSAYSTPLAFGRDVRVDRHDVRLVARAPARQNSGIRVTSAREGPFRVRRASAQFRVEDREPRGRRRWASPCSS